MQVFQKTYDMIAPVFSYFIDLYSLDIIFYDKVLK